ncbi:MAG: PKD domain-containing protein, partial [Saprospiraceae bacterium]|nr:PKD domain-containing protein [Saprospiraceae bacterium]
HLDTIGISQVTAEFSVDDDGGCVPFTFSLTDISVSAYGELTTWIIDWNDGGVDTFYNYSDVLGVAHTFTYNDRFDVAITVIDEFGCSDTFIDTITAGEPTVNFSVDDTIPCIGQIVYFSEEATGYGLDYFWDFGDGAISTFANPPHDYDASGAYTVSLSVTDENGCTASLVVPLFIETDTVNADFGADILVASCNYSLVQFNSSSTDSICEYLWQFGDGGISVDPNPIYPYLEAGSYFVSLTVTDCNGCESTILKEGFITVPGPYGTITFSDDTLCVDQAFEIYLTITSTDTLTLYLDNGDVINTDVVYSDSAQTITIPYTYTAAGAYYPGALLVDTNSCLNIIDGGDTVRVGNNPTAFYEVPDPTACIGTIFVFSDSSSSPDPILLWQWDVGDDTYEIDFSTTFNHTYTDIGYYNTSLFVYTEFGCVDSMFVDVNVLPYPTVALTSDSAICPGQNVPLLASGGTEYIWTPSAGLSDSSIANPLADPDTTTTYIVEVSNGYCSSFDSILVTIVEDLMLNAGPDTLMCIGADVQLYSEFTTDLGIDNIDFYWSPADYLSDPFVEDPVSTTLDDIVYTIYATCGLLNDSADAMIEITSPPDIEIPEDTIVIILGQTIELAGDIISSGGSLFYQWEPRKEVDCPLCETVLVAPRTNTIFSLEVTDELGCSDIDFVLVRVLTCDETLFYIPNIISPNNDGFNDVFKFTFEGVSEVHAVRIYDRWGELLFQTTNLDIHWDGTYNGVVCNPGVYVYMIDATCFDGTKTVIPGNITLVK